MSSIGRALTFVCPPNRASQNPKGTTVFVTVPRLKTPMAKLIKRCFIQSLAAGALFDRSVADATRHGIDSSDGDA